MAQSALYLASCGHSQQTWDTSVHKHSAQIWLPLAERWGLAEEGLALVSAQRRGQVTGHGEL